MAPLPRPTPATIVRAAALAASVIRFSRGTRRAPALRPTPNPALASAPTDVAIVVPARDEADRIGDCVRSLVSQNAPVLVVDDGSTDDTRAVAEACGARVVDAGELPDGWAGKVHALQVGLECTDATVVVAVDADTRAEPGFVDAMVAALGDSTLVTGGARVDAAEPRGRLVHASMLASIIYRFGPPGVVPHRSERTMANGQCMVFDRRRFLDAGGFGPVAGSLIEDVAVARHLASLGHMVRFEDATGIITVEGYGGAAATLRGWGRSLALRDVTSAPWTVADLAVVWLSMALPLPRLLTGRGDAIDAAALALRGGVAAATAGAFRERGWPLALAPLADLAVATKLTAGAIRPARSWRGRDYD